MQAFFTIHALWKREIIKFVRDRSRLIGALAQPLGFWVLLGLGFRDTFRMPAETAASIGYMEFLFPGIIALIILFTAVFTTISIVEERKSGFLQAVMVAPASRLTLVLGNTLGGTTLAVVQALIYLMFLPTLGLPPNPMGILLVTLISILTGLAFTSLGFIIAWRMDSTRGFHAVMNLFLLPMWFLSGAFFPAEGASPVLSWIIRLNPVTYAVSGLREAIYWPQAAPISAAPLWLSLLISFAFAGVLLVVAVRTARRSLFAAA